MHKLRNSKDNQMSHFGSVEEILSHELVHMFDYCTKKINFDQIEHLACSEIRAASLVSCAKFNWNYWSFEHCVKAKAAHSVAVIKNCDRNEAKKNVDKDVKFSNLIG